MGVFDIFKKEKNENNKGIDYIQKLKETYINRGYGEKWKYLEEISNGISIHDKQELLKEYPNIPKSLIDILSEIDGTYHRKYEEGEINYYFFGSDVDDGGYPYYLLQGSKILETKDEPTKYYDYFINREYDDIIPVNEKITNDINNVKWLHFANCMNNGGTSTLYIDFSPSDKGKVGQVIRILHDPDSLEVIADSFDDFLDMIIENDFKFIDENEN